MKIADVQPIEWLMWWYQSNCNGDWEHQNGVEIGTLDNPGWYLDVDIGETAKAGSILEPNLVERTSSDWVSVEVKNDTFKACGGPRNLAEMIRLFANFVEGEQ